MRRTERSAALRQSVGTDGRISGTPRVKRAIAIACGCRTKQTGCANLTTTDFVDLVRAAHAGRDGSPRPKWSPQNRHLVADIQRSRHAMLCATAFRAAPCAATYEG